MLEQELERKTPKYMQAKDSMVNANDGASEDITAKMSPKEKRLYNIVQGYFSNMGAVESLNPMQRNMEYGNLAKMYNNIAAHLESKPEYKQEAMLLKVMALAYAQNAVKYGQQGYRQPGYAKNSVNTSYSLESQAGQDPAYSNGHAGCGSCKK